MWQLRMAAKILGTFSPSWPLENYRGGRILRLPRFRCLLLSTYATFCAVLAVQCSRAMVPRTAAAASADGSDLFQFRVRCHFREAADDAPMDHFQDG